MYCDCVQPLQMVLPLPGTVIQHHLHCIPLIFKQMGFIRAIHLVAGYLSFIHLTVGAGSPTALQGRTISFIQGVVTVPLNVKILAGAEQERERKMK